MRLTIRKKLMGGFMIILILMVLMGYMAVQLINHVQDDHHNAEQLMDDIIFTVEKEVDHLAWLNQLADSFLVNSTFEGQLNPQKCSFGEWYYNMLQDESYTEFSSKFQETFLKIEKPHQLLHESAKKINELLQDEQNTAQSKEQALQVYQLETQKYITEIRSLFHNLREELTEAKTKNISAATNQARTALKLIIVLTGIAVILGLLIAFVISRGITRPITEVVTFLKELSQSGGDLTRRIRVKSRDEIGDLAHWFNSFIERLNEILLKVRKSSHTVADAAKEITDGNQDLSQRTEEQASSLEEFASAIEEITSSIEASAANADQANHLSTETLDSVQDGQEVVEELKNAMDDITVSSEKIGEIIASVNDIAFQTNLLALNAAVEAARAGEQGRGFAVVAAEVRNLASRSSDSAEEIESLIKDSNIRVQRGNELMKRTKSVLSDIILNTEKTADVIGEITASMREQSTAANEIDITIAELNQVTQQNASLVEEIAASSEGMRGEVLELSDLVELFKLKEELQTPKSTPTPQSNAKKEIATTDDDGDFDIDDFEKF